MINLGLNTNQKLDLINLLTTHHSIFIQLNLLDLNHVNKGEISRHLLGGQVNIDTESGDATRQAQLDLLDPAYQLRLDPHAPDDGSLYMNRMIQIKYHVISPRRDRRYVIPIFTGPITKADRNGPVLKVECLGKEYLSKPNIWASKDFAENSSVRAAMLYMLDEVMGEAFFDIDNSDAKLKNKVTLTQERTIWEVVARFAQFMDHVAFYNGEGTLISRKIPDSVQYTFAEAREILSKATIGYDIDNLVNAAKVTGKSKGKNKGKATGRYVAPNSHPLSPQELGRKNRDGKVIDRYYPEWLDDSGIKTDAEANKKAEALVQEKLHQAIEVAFDSLPVVLVEENDLCRIQTEEYNANFRLKKCSIPLVANAYSTIGYLKKVGSPSGGVMSSMAKTNSRL